MVGIPPWKIYQLWSMGDFLIVAVIIPLLYILLNIFIRKLVSDENRLENCYIGVDLTLASLAAVGIYLVEPTKRLIGRLSWETDSMVHYKISYGTSIALAIDVILLLFALCNQRDFEKKKQNKPYKTWTNGEKALMFCTNGLINNSFGLLSAFVTAFLLRG